MRRKAVDLLLRKADMRDTGGHKEYKYLYQRMLDEEVIRKAYKKLRKGKTKRNEIIYIDAHLDEEVQKMHDMILNTKPPDVPVEHPELAYRPHRRTPKIIFEHGKHRKIYMPEIHEQWLHHIIVLILEPIITATAYPYSCGSFPKRGAHYGKRQIERWIRRCQKDMRYFAKMDIRHFYDNIRLKILMRELRIRIKDEWFLYIIELCLQGFSKGVPLGFYISQWLANYLLEPLDRFITEKLGLKIMMRYMDDITIYAANKKVLHQAIALDQAVHRAKVPAETETDPPGMQVSLPEGQESHRESAGFYGFCILSEPDSDPQRHHALSDQDGEEAAPGKGSGAGIFRKAHGSHAQLHGMVYLHGLLRVLRRKNQAVCINRQDQENHFKNQKEAEP